MDGVKCLVEQWKETKEKIEKEYEEWYELRNKENCENKVYRDWPENLQRKWDVINELYKVIEKLEKELYSELREKVFKIDETTYVIAYYADDPIIEIRKLYEPND